MNSSNQSDNSINNFAFIFLVIVIFIVLLNFTLLIISGLFKPSGSPILLDGMKPGNTLLTISQNPTNKQSIPIARSNNQKEGITFTWSVWLYVDDLKIDNTYKHIFNKGSGTYQNRGLYYPNNSPGLYLSPNVNNLELFMNVYKNPNTNNKGDCYIDPKVIPEDEQYNICSISEKIIINNIPIKKWMCVIIRCEQNVIDCYVNGTLTKRHILSGVPIQNYDNIYICNNGGFDGYVSNLRYYNYALGTTNINNISKAGPNLKVTEDDSSLSQTSNKYFSMRWYFNNTDTQNIGYGGLS